MPCVGCVKECKCTLEKCAADCKCEKPGNDCSCRGAGGDPPCKPAGDAHACSQQHHDKGTQATGKTCCCVKDAKPN